MRQPVASTSRAIRIVTAAVLILNAGLYVAALFQPAAIYAAVGISAIVLISYFLWTPVSYELVSGELNVSFRFGCRRYSPVTKCSPVEAPLRAGIRVFGNGGLFAGSGIFWNRTYGMHRAYVTSTRPEDLVLVETTDTRILISPQDAGAWLRASGH
jgi:hypothetical protein